MRKIIKIMRVVEKTSARGDKYIQTTAKFDDGTIATGFGEYQEGEFCEVFFHDKYNKIKFRRSK